MITVYIPKSLAVAWVVLVAINAITGLGVLAVRLGWLP